MSRVAPSGRGLWGTGYIMGEGKLGMLARSPAPGRLMAHACVASRHSHLQPTHEVANPSPRRGSPCRPVDRVRGAQREARRLLASSDPDLGRNGSEGLA